MKYLFGFEFGIRRILLGAGLGGLLLAVLIAGCSRTVGKVDESDIGSVENRISQMESEAASKNQTPEVKPVEPVKTEPEALSPMSAEAASGPLPASSRPDIRIMYQEGRNLLVNRQYLRASAVFEQILETAPRDSLAPNARYWLGECHYTQGRFTEAMVEFDRVIQDYPRSSKAPDAMLKKAYCYSKLGDGNAAMVSLRNLLRRYPQSSAAEMVRSGRTVFPRP